MAIYGHTMDNLLYTNSYTILENTILDTDNFIQSLIEESVLTESKISDFVKTVFEKIKELIDKVITFLKSIPGRIRSLFKKKEQKSSFDPNGFAEGPGFEDKEYPDNLYNYEKMMDDIVPLVRVNVNEFMDKMSFQSNKAKFEATVKEYEDIEGLLNKRCPKVIGVKDIGSLTSYLNSEKFQKNYILKNKNSKYLKDHFDVFEDMEDYVDNFINEADKAISFWEKTKKDTEKQLKELEQFPTLLKHDEEEEIRAGLRQVISIIAKEAAINKAVFSFLNSTAANILVQNNRIENFLKSCYTVDTIRIKTFRTGNSEDIS